MACKEFKQGEVIPVEYKGETVQVELIVVEVSKKAEKCSYGECVAMLAARLTGERFIKSRYGRERNMGLVSKVGSPRGGIEQVFNCLCDVCHENIRISSKVVTTEGDNI